MRRATWPPAMHGLILEEPISGLGTLAAWPDRSLPLDFGPLPLAPIGFQLFQSKTDLGGKDQKRAERNDNCAQAVLRGE